MRPKTLSLRPRQRPEPAVRAAPASSSKPNRHLFHYTTSDGLVGLLKSNCIFASHYGFLNDQLEGKTLRDFLRPNFEREMADFVPKLIKRGILKDAILTENGPNYYQAEAGRLFDAYDRSTDNVAPPFITSFCIHTPDTPEFANGLLSQWRGYGRGGFAIEFEEAAIDDLAAKEYEAFAYQGVLTNQVRYRDFGDVVDPEKFKGWVATMFKVVLKEKHPNATWDLEAILGNNTTEDYARAYLSNVSFLKKRGVRGREGVSHCRVMQSSRRQGTRRRATF